MYKTVALLTDFGIEDHYTGVVKGRILQELTYVLGLKIPFQINFIDLTHKIPPQDIRKAALLLYFSYKYFPANTVFLAIVDPGVGTERRAIILQTKNYIFVGPDNGIFTLVYKEISEFKVFEILPDKILKPPYSSTFHGRDLFAPVVAYILANKSLNDFSQPLSKDSLVKLDFPLPEKTEKGYKLSIWYVDHFGNIITNFHKDLAIRSFKVLANGKELPLVKSYGYAKTGELVALFGSENLLEIAINGGSAISVLKSPEIEIIFD